MYGKYVNDFGVSANVKPTSNQWQSAGFRAAEKIAKIRQKTFGLERFQFATIEPRVIALRTQIHDDLFVTFTALFEHRHIATRARQRFLLMGFIRNLVPFEEDVIMLHFDLCEILGAEKRAFARFTNVHFFENRMVGQTPANEFLFTTRTLHRHGASVTHDERVLSSFSCTFSFSTQAMVCT